MDSFELISLSIRSCKTYCCNYSEFAFYGNVIFKCVLTLTSVLCLLISVACGQKSDISAQMYTVCGKVKTKIYFDVFMIVHHSIDFFQVTNLMHTSFIL